MNQVVLSTNTVPNRAFRDFPQPKNGFYLPAQKEEEQKKRSHALGITIGATALIAGFGTLALMKGVVPKGFRKLLENLKHILEEKVEKGSRFKRFYRKSLDVVNDLQDKSSSINNITSLKDVLFKRLMCGKDGKRPFTAKIHNGITNVFNRISRNTVNSSYAKTEKRFTALSEYLSSINKTILNENPSKKNIISEIENKIASLNSEYEKGFGINARNNRLQSTQKAMDELFNQFWDKSFGNIKENFKSKRMYQSFIAEDLLKPTKANLAKTTLLNKKAIIKNIDQVLKDYKSLLSEKEYSKLQKRTKSVIKSLDSSIETETNKYFDKARDMKLGSAPTDVLSIATGLGAVSWYAAKAKDKDERISSVLKYGIPAIGTIATSLYCNARLISGGKALGFALISGLLINKAGVALDNLRKKYSLDISFINKTLLKAQSDAV